MRTVNWYSQFKPTASQVVEIKRLFGAATQIDPRVRPGNAAEVASDFRQSGAHDLVVVTASAVLEHILREGLRPLYPQMVECDRNHPQQEVGPVKGKYFRFEAFRRLVQLEYQAEPPKPVRGAPVRAVVVLRITQHAATPEEELLLSHLYGGEHQHPTMEVDLRGGAAAVKAAMVRAGAHDLVLVAPMTLYEALCAEGVYPLRVIMDGHRFVCLRRVVGVTWKFEELP